MKHLAFDLGASSGRGIVSWMDENGKMCMEEIHRFPNHPYEKDGRFHWNFNALVKELETGLQKAFAFAGDIATFSIDTWGVDVVWFRNGQPIREPFSYRDPRFVRAQEDAHKILSAEQVYAYTGIQEMSFNTVYQMFAHKEDFPEDFTDGAKMLFMPDALMAMLTGEFTTEYTIASTGALLNPQTRGWHTELLQKLDIPTCVLTDIVEPCKKYACLKKDVAERLGIPAIPCVKCGSHDTASAVAAIPAPQDGEHAYISMGTWALFGIEIQNPCMSKETFLAKFTNEGGICNTIRFLTNISGTWLLQESRNTWLQNGEKISFGEMCDLAMAEKTDKRFDPNDPVFATPGDMPARIAEYCRTRGQGEFRSRGELLRCIYESLAEACAQKFVAMEQLRNAKYRRLHILGGGTKDEFLMQLIANKIGVPVVAGPVEATAIGNILAQMLASSEIHSLSQGRACVAVFGTHEYEPQVSIEENMK